MATPVQQRLLDLGTEIATTPPEDFAFQHSVLTQTSLPTAKPQEGVLVWDRPQGKARLRVEAGSVLDPKTNEYVTLGLPYGPKARLLLMHLNSEAVRRQSPVIPVEDSMTAFFRRLMGKSMMGVKFGASNTSFPLSQRRSSVWASPTMTELSRSTHRLSPPSSFGRIAAKGGVCSGPQLSSSRSTTSTV